MRPFLKWDGPQTPEMTLKRLREVNEFLFHAVEHNTNIETLRNVLAAGADLTARDAQGRTALAIATEVGNRDYVRLLQEAGAKE